MNVSRKFGILVAGILTAGGARVPTFNDSGIPKALNTDALLLTAGKPQGIGFDGRTVRLSNPSEYAVERESYFRVTISSGTADQLVRAYKDAFYTETAGRGGHIRTAT